MLEFERQAWATGFMRVAGVDEAGRGPLAGPVVAAAIFIPRPCLESAADGDLHGLTDSKLLSPRRRERFYDALQDHPDIRFHAAAVEAPEIDRINILKATHLAMRLALSGMGQIDHALVDGRPVPGLPCSSRGIVKGDSLSLLIAAASVIAKVTRDAVMVRLHETFPEYGFDRHKGYGTPQHLAALRRHGPASCHRRSFRPVAQLELEFGQKGPEA